MVLFFVDRLRLRNGSHTVVLQPSSVRGVGSAPPAYVQRIQPSTQLPRGQNQPSVASSSVWEDLRTQSGSLALDDSPSLRAPVVYLRSRSCFNDPVPRVRHIHIRRTRRGEQHSWKGSLHSRRIRFFRGRRNYDHQYVLVHSAYIP
jgi:hypothetical protein